MRVISGFFTVGVGFCVVLVGILLGCTLIGLIWALPVASSGFVLIAKGMAEMGIGTYQAVSSKQNSKE